MNTQLAGVSLVLYMHAIYVTYKIILLPLRKQHITKAFGRILKCTLVSSWSSISDQQSLRNTNFCLYYTVNNSMRYLFTASPVFLFSVRMTVMNIVSVMHVIQRISLLYSVCCNKRTLVISTFAAFDMLETSAI